MSHSTVTTGKLPILKSNLPFRQQLHRDDNPDLASLLGITRQFFSHIATISEEDEKYKNFLKILPAAKLDQMLKESLDQIATLTNANERLTWINMLITNQYDVFVFELCDGNIAKENKKDLFRSKYTSKNGEFTLVQSVDICKQLLEGLLELEQSNKCHNDLKPENILYKVTDEKFENGDSRIMIKIGDFGTADRSGGTPGWTWPRFLSEREPGRSDMYSVALLILYVQGTLKTFYNVSLIFL